MNDTFTKIAEIGIVPVIKIDDAKQALPLAQALKEGGIPCAEITFRTPQAEEAISLISHAMPEILVGAGTVTTVGQVDKALSAGAQFIVSPGFNPHVVEYCLEKGIPITPGCVSPSDIERAMELELKVVKFFPAETSGGIKAIKAISAAYRDVKFMPTGGINEKNINDYLTFPQVVACGGSWMAPSELLKAGDFSGIKRLSREAIKIVLGFELGHVGINGQNENDAKLIVDLFCRAFGFESKSGGSSIFAGNAVEVMKEPCFGRNGHIAVTTNSISRAKRYLRENGFAFDEATEKLDAEGNAVSVYLSGDFGGFAVHLLKK